MKRSPVVATIALLTVVIGTPLLIAIRLSGELSPVQAADALLAAFVLCWIQVCIAVLRRDDALDSLTQPRFSMRWQADNLVAQSMLGSGFTARQPVLENGLVQVAAPVASIDALLPTPAPVGQLADRNDDGTEDPPHIVPSLHEEPESDGPEILATEEYVVARGDTFWSIAEYAFGDGRHWKLVQDLNLGREVAPGIMLNEAHEPRIGWSILVPLVASPAEADESSADIVS